MKIKTWDKILLGLDVFVIVMAAVCLICFTIALLCGQL